MGEGDAKNSDIHRFLFQHIKCQEQIENKICPIPVGLGLRPFCLFLRQCFNRSLKKRSKHLHAVGDEDDGLVLEHLLDVVDKDVLSHPAHQ